MTSIKSKLIMVGIIAAVLLSIVAWRVTRPPLTPEEKARIESFSIVLETAQSGALLENASGKIIVIHSVDLKKHWIKYCDGPYLEARTIDECAKKFHRLYNPGDPDYPEATRKFISQMVTRAK